MSQCRSKRVESFPVLMSPFTPELWSNALSLASACVMFWRAVPTPETGVGLDPVDVAGGVRQGTVCTFPSPPVPLRWPAVQAHNQNRATRRFSGVYLQLEARCFQLALALGIKAHLSLSLVSDATKLLTRAGHPNPTAPQRVFWFFQLLTGEWSIYSWLKHNGGVAQAFIHRMREALNRF